MPSADTLLADACTSKVACATHRDLLVIIAQALAESAGMTADELLQAACTSRVACLGERDLLVVIAQSLSGGGSVGGAQEVYTGAAPPAAPADPTKPALYYPTGGGTLFQWDGAAWV